MVLVACTPGSPDRLRSMSSKSGTSEADLSIASPPLRATQATSYPGRDEINSESIFDAPGDLCAMPMRILSGLSDHIPDRVTQALIVKAAFL